MTERIMYHVAGEGYQTGDPLLCWDRQAELGTAAAWKWDEAEEGFDGDVVCLFGSEDEAREFADTHGGLVVRVSIPKSIEGSYPLPWGGSLHPRMTTVAEGFTAVADGIPAEWIEVAW